jgi:hypothetical protein
MRRRHIFFFLAATLALAAATARAQSGDLSGVTMRVLDDVSDISAVILELDASRGEEEGARRDEADSAESDTTPAAEGQGDEPREREALHDPDDDERSEGKLEDNDVERAAAPPTP